MRSASGEKFGLAGKAAEGLDQVGALERRRGCVEKAEDLGGRAGRAMVRGGVDLEDAVERGDERGTSVLAGARGGEEGQDGAVGGVADQHLDGQRLAALVGAGEVGGDEAQVGLVELGGALAAGRPPGGEGGHGEHGIAPAEGRRHEQPAAAHGDREQAQPMRQGDDQGDGEADSSAPARLAIPLEKAGDAPALTARQEVLGHLLGGSLDGGVNEAGAGLGDHGDGQARIEEEGGPGGHGGDRRDQEGAPDAEGADEIGRRATPGRRGWPGS